MRRKFGLKSLEHILTLLKSVRVVVTVIHGNHTVGKYTGTLTTSTASEAGKMMMLLIAEKDDAMCYVKFEIADVAKVELTDINHPHIVVQRGRKQILNKEG